MEGASSLLGVPPPTRPFILPSSPHRLPSLALPTTSTLRGASLITRAEPPPPDGEKGRSSEEASVSTPPPSPKKLGGGGSGFGSSVSDTKRKRRVKERRSVIRRPPIERSSLLYSGDEEGRSPQGQQQSVNESAFILTWLGLGFLILVEGIALAASGFLPEEWDSFFVKYLYPSFTPTVVLFIGGTVAYGVFKYLQGEKLKS